MKRFVTLLLTIAMLYSCMAFAEEPTGGVWGNPVYEGTWYAPIEGGYPDHDHW